MHQGRCHPRQVLRGDFFLLRAGLNGRKPCPAALPGPAQGVFLHSQTLSAVSRRHMENVWGDMEKTKL